MGMVHVEYTGQTDTDCRLFDHHQSFLASVEVSTARMNGHDWVKSWIQSFRVAVQAMVVHHSWKNVVVVF